ncbi:MAG: serine hydrolase domain-containing protein [Candidatus Cloacimonadales bacterium]
MQKLMKIINDELSALSSESTAIIARFYWADKIFYRLNSGFSNLEYSVRADNDTLFPISSMTKQFTAAVIYKLQKQGLLDFQNYINYYYPQLHDLTKKITIKHLLDHTSGLTDPYLNAQNCQTYNLTNKAVLEIIYQQAELLFTPGEKFHYCNSNYVLLSQIAEKVSGKKFSNLLDELIFKPLKMRDSLLYDKRYVIKNRAYGYRKKAQNKYYTTDLLWLSYGDGGIFSSIKDLQKWYFACRDNLSFRAAILDSEELRSEAKLRYSLGWFIVGRDDCEMLYHLGGDPGFGSIIAYSPGKDFGFIILTNLDEAWKNLEKLRKNIYLHFAESYS